MHFSGNRVKTKASKDQLRAKGTTLTKLLEAFLQAAAGFREADGLPGFTSYSWHCVALWSVLPVMRQQHV
ncbi:hypothetical protein CgunFtcFv8_018216 [Champsocephalus gunnari]|uniref:Uncharacterized protein n=1 Tax=Champsocephalus gunnari TaxID=52237 RepID=A0AAN8DP81_CHAGU|nr:hypothetical protein CgunFtcFv8_018216 [Champsocephalus gunnari]